MSEKLNDRDVVLTGAKQTMAAWSKVIESYEEVPTIYKDSLDSQIADNQRFPYTLLAPALSKPRGKTTEKLIYDKDGAIHILEQNSDQVVTKSYPYQTACILEMGNILLSSWLTISGITNTGAASISTIDFNTSSTRHFETFLTKLRPTPEGADEAKLKAEKDKFNYLSPLNFKLMNYGRSSLVYGEIVFQILSQPEIREPIWGMLGDMFQRMLTSAHLTILTNHELILIQDTGHDKKTEQPHYGGVWQYIPLRSIKSATWSESENGHLTFSVKVSPDRTIEKIFAVSSKPELEQLCAQLPEISGKNP